MTQDPTPTPNAPQEVADDLLALLPPRTATERHEGPVYYLWVFDPETGEAHVDHNEGRHRANTITHDDMHPEVTHPERLNGYAYRIKGGWRITDDAHHKVEDPFITGAIVSALRKAEPPKPLPNF